MPTTINLTADVPANHQLTITLPDDIPTGPADIMLIVASQQPAELSTLAELAESEFFGLRGDRADIVNSTASPEICAKKPGAASRDDAA